MDLYPAEDVDLNIYEPYLKAGIGSTTMEGEVKSIRGGI